MTRRAAQAGPGRRSGVAEPRSEDGLA